ncbi:MAG: CDC27 family protein [Treponemataceae bacterium]|nr:CDC27 family protein [Treponemataceae bacterium]
MRKKVCFLIIVVFAATLYAASGNAGRSFALRYLNLAMNAVSADDYETADALSVTGLSYDQTVSDFWFIRANAAEKRNDPPKNIIEYLEKAITYTDWLKYSKTNAVIMLADLYYTTGSYSKCIDILKDASKYSVPEVYYLEAASMYALNKVKEARNIISFATSLYPDNAEFVSLFFRNEYEICQKSGAQVPYKETSNVELCQSLLKRVYSIFEKSPEILLYAAFFADQEEASNLIRLYTAGTDVYGYDIFYPFASMKCGFLTETQAFDAYTEISGGVFKYDVFSKMAREMKSENARSHLQSVLSGFSATIKFSSLENGVYDLTCSYKYGRPEKIVYDRTDDGVVEWYIECDYGAPVYCMDNEHQYSVRYHSFPSIKNAEFLSTGASYSFVPFSENWTPVVFEKASFGNDNNPFFIPVLSEKSVENGRYQILSETDALKNANQVKLPLSDGNKNEVVFSLFEKKPVSATYFENGTEYADAVFSNGLLSLRNVDMDRDGVKEMKEMYRIPYEKTDEKTQKTLTSSLFGKLPYNHDLWLSDLYIDTDGDTSFDYHTVYSEDGWTHSFWGVDENGGYESSYSENFDGSLREVQFYHPLENVLITAMMRGERLITISVGKEIYSIFYDEPNDFYWVYKRPSESSFVPKIKSLLDEQGSGLNVMVIYDLEDGSRVLAEKTCGVYFGVIVYD